MDNFTLTCVLILVFYAGACFGGWLARKPPVINVKVATAEQVIYKVDDSAMKDLSIAVVASWLDKNGMVWQPKGAVPPPVEKKNGSSA